jgi:AcrR family transcriptional regulator
MATTTARRRLDPLVRRDLILDVAARTIAEVGVSAVSMERLGRDAGVSKALVYNYFPNRNALLSELLVREYRMFQNEARQAKAGIKDFPELVRVTTRAYLSHVAERGMLIQRLMNEPAVSSAIRSVDEEGRQLTVAFFGSEIARHYGLSLSDSAMAADLLMGLTGAAGDYLCRTGANIGELENVVVAMIMAALARMPVAGA